MLDGTHFFECDCGHNEHTLRFVLDFDGWGDGEPMLHTEVMMNHYQPWYRRMVIAMRYVLGVRTHGSHFDCWILDRRQAARLRDMAGRVAQWHGDEEGKSHIVEKVLREQAPGLGKSRIVEADTDTLYTVDPPDIRGFLVPEKEDKE